MNNRKLKIYLLLFILFISSLNSYAGSVEMADIMRNNGKIYVVVAVLSIIFIGLITYLVLIDRKLTKLEKEIDQHKNN